MLPDSIGAQGIDHIGLTTDRFDEALSGLMKMPAAALLRGPLDNRERGVRQAFVQIGAEPVIELLCPLASASHSPITQHVRAGGGPHHICFQVAELGLAVRAAERQGARVILGPTPDVAFEGRSIVFLVDGSFGLVELVESEPSEPVQVSNATAQSGLLAVRREDVTNIDGALREVFSSTFPALEASHVQLAELEKTPGWDSLGHIRLMIAIEQRLGVVIPSNVVAELVNFDAFRKFCAGLAR